MQAVLTWTPASGGNSTGQKVQYRVKGGTWLDWSSVGPLVSTETITGLNDNSIYEFQVVNICSVGGSSVSNQSQGIKITCPAVTTSALTYNSFSYSFNPLGGDIVDYVVELRNPSNALVGTQTVVSANPVSGSFSGLIASTTYSLKVIPRTASQTYTKPDCAIVNVTTSAAPACAAPTNVSATIS